MGKNPVDTNKYTSIWVDDVIIRAVLI